MSKTKTLSSNIKQLRKSLNESQEEFAFNCDLSTRTIYEIEHGRSIPKNYDTYKNNILCKYKFMRLVRQKLVLSIAVFL